MKVFAAMSGGVDSSLTAALLLEQGYAVAGVTMCFELPSAARPGTASCCGREAIDAARSVCRHLGIEHHVLNYGDVLEELVIRDFAEEYVRGRTPNPCVRCNTFLKFDRLFRDIRGLGGTHLATGHYARVEASSRGWVLRKGVDESKDQSYFLYGIRRESLPFVLFPLGAYTKSQVRAMARERALPVAERPDSQDICFVTDGKYYDVVAARSPGGDRPGDMLDHNGRVVSRHAGLSRYTIGQREGLGIALGYPAYVYQLDSSSNTVRVGPREKLLCCGLEAEGLRLTGMDFSQEKFDAGLKIRYNRIDIPASVYLGKEATLRAVFHTPQHGVTPGQSVVFYDGDVVLGGALITGVLPDDFCLMPAKGEI
jgi:tRNA-specific 2-thiouridylase